MSALEAGKKGRAYERPEKPVRPRDAASLVICRQRKGVTEVLMGRRASRHRFMPNIFVFPGGRVDTADRQAKIAADLAKPVARKLQNKWSPQMARALASIGVWAVSVSTACCPIWPHWIMSRGLLRRPTVPCASMRGFLPLM